MKQFADLAVYIGRFQPLHLGHLHAIKRGMNIANHVLVLMGDTGGARSIKNPWTYEERRQMLMRSLPADCSSAPDCAPRVLMDQIFDFPYNEQQWLTEVQERVQDAIEKIGGARKIILIGHAKDASSYYLKMFPQWTFHDTGYEEFEGQHERKIDATKIREFIFEDQIAYTAGVLGREVRDHITYLRGMNPQIHEDLVFEYDAIKKYRKSWASAPFPPVFVTTDVMCVQSGHILLVKRGERPGKGLWALPGGFIDQSESIEDCALRELYEETDIHLQPEVLRRCITHVQVFDRAGGVSSADRGRIITHAHVIELNHEKDLPKVRGGDDAAEAKWVPISELNPREIFSDHHHIIHALLGRL